MSVVNYAIYVLRIPHRKGMTKLNFYVVLYSTEISSSPYQLHMKGIAQILDNRQFFHLCCITILGF